MTITLCNAAGPCAVGMVTAIRRRDIARHRAWVTRTYPLAVGAGTQLFTQGLGEAISATRKGSKDLLQGSAWLIVINLAVAEDVIRRPKRR
jgi:hypothetical protein